MNKERIDTLVVQKGLFDSREKAKRAIMAGLVLADDEVVDKPGAKISDEAALRLKGKQMPYVSRGGLKLEKAIQTFQLELQDAVVLDVGASTGGFTDCALQNGASIVYALDVGYNQLAWKLRQAPRVEVMERVNFRYLDKSQLTRGLPGLLIADVSFISLEKLFPVMPQVLAPGAGFCVLIKPQFEAGREKVGRKGIVRDPSVHREVLIKTIQAAESFGLVPEALDFSPITGGDGNIEYLLYGKVLSDKPSHLGEERIEAVVQEAHDSFKKKLEPS
ncbi:23S rRNA (cytidine1920-2'-O)/16S rRNA (cytidine1409-2'-O)-methyltransferase [Marinococcus luteus]|uniref:23S rRNA (Cytidine1920-2'-O)/16S rRNA (Cytidine1409-2'-O)-methyltransferase n=1 Tax=Marinococcus luteus TaxID=1122204 RepID=A0A1H2RTC0_9BACI|nr:TlyA family RNA methyltransferase [Marinococcus luteus]SDW22671.1 23S rRNA (cytidine1920-2'-O)/16S rRNA (cytidine1409-2'-O)-methyltransferase [Marinococcus luteus]